MAEPQILCPYMISTFASEQKPEKVELPGMLKCHSFPLEEAMFSWHRYSQEYHFSTVRSTSCTRTSVVVFPALAINPAL